jgi:hypothetical protein
MWLMNPNAALAALDSLSGVSASQRSSSRGPTILAGTGGSGLPRPGGGFPGPGGRGRPGGFDPGPGGGGACGECLDEYKCMGTGSEAFCQRTVRSCRGDRCVVDYFESVDDGDCAGGCGTSTMEPSEPQSHIR